MSQALGNYCDCLLRKIARFQGSTNALLFENKQSVAKCWLTIGFPYSRDQIQRKRIQIRIQQTEISSSILLLKSMVTIKDVGSIHVGD